ncbi:DUF1206 domain-containing protein [Pseudonocardia sp. C8]|uniref:DUF1206 domain-containing protein n=1 Tax=Pseudonocardia sp. C8 TaxID=2762759 RepID=UPI0016427CDC|nr:DUF1206 domain-containing protein [Pseudonocardia sp. C8]MBC3193618.1 DUF1206 domain-containing protein [Pseudonocardia sp. C8]
MVSTPDAEDVHRAGRTADRGARAAARSAPVRVAARVGIAAYGVLHLLIGWLAVQVALGSGAPADQNGAFTAIAAEPMGRVLLWVVVAGFAAVVLWRALVAVRGVGVVGSRGFRIWKRIASAGLAVVYAALGAAAATTAVQGRTSSGGSRAAAGVLGLPGGPVLIAVVGVVVLAVGGNMIRNGWRKQFTEDQDLFAASLRTRRLNARTGQVGFIAKGVAIGVVGVLLVSAALTYDPQRANGLDAALKTLREQPYGVVLLLAVGLGIACYGLFCFFDARYHRVS